MATWIRPSLTWMRHAPTADGHAPRAIRPFLTSRRPSLRVRTPRFRRMRRSLGTGRLASARGACLIHVREPSPAVRRHRYAVRDGLLAVREGLLAARDGLLAVREHRLAARKLRYTARHARPRIDGTRPCRSVQFNASRLNAPFVAPRGSRNPKPPAGTRRLRQRLLSRLVRLGIAGVIPT
jgi:hypothetical protein